MTDSDKVKFTKNLRYAINVVSQAILPDIDTDDREEIAECTIDADRLAIYGYAKENEEVRLLVKIHGYEAVLKEAVKCVTLWG